MDPNQNQNAWWSQLMSSGGLLGAGLAGMFGNEKNPANAAQPYLNQIPGAMNQYLGPYMNAGAGALPNLQQQYGALTGELPGLQNQYNAMMNPNFINNMGKNFQQSPGFQFAVNQDTNAANRAAAAGGMLGSPQEQQNLAGSITGMANQDYYNWLDHAMNAYNTGLQGQQGLYGMGLQGEQGLAQMGMNAGGQMAQGMQDALMSQANLAYAGQQNQNQQQGGNWGSLLGGGLGLLGSLGSLAGFF